MYRVREDFDPEQRVQRRRLEMVPPDTSVSHHPTVAIGMLLKAHDFAHAPLRQTAISAVGIGRVAAVVPVANCKTFAYTIANL